MNSLLYPETSTYSGRLGVMRRMQGFQSSFIEGKAVLAGVNGEWSLKYIKNPPQFRTRHCVLVIMLNCSSLSNSLTIVPLPIISKIFMHDMGIFVLLAS